MITVTTESTNTRLVASIVGTRFLRWVREQLHFCNDKTEKGLWHTVWKMTKQSKPERITVQVKN